MTGILDGRPLADIGAERAALGAAIQSPQAAAEVAEVVSAEDFHDEHHRTLFERLMAMRRHGAPIDPQTVRIALDEAGEFVGNFQAPYLVTLMQACPAVSNAAGYAHRVAKIATYRRAAHELEGALRAVTAGADLAEVAARVTAVLDMEARLADLDSPRGGSWRPVDLGPILRGEKVRAEPTVGLARSDGLRLLYPGKEHSVIGEMESGKSWFCAACCAAEITAGRHVLYVHFEEADPTDTVERLLALDVRGDDIADLFRFVGPDEPVRPGILAALLDPPPSLVVLDGVNEAMALHGQAIREEDGAAAFRRLLVKPCTAVGAATLSADHVVKDREKRDRGPLGSVHKGNGLSGSLILLENADPFGRGQRGRSHIYVTKDRPGHLRRAGRATKVPGKTFMGELVVDDTRMQVPYLDLTFWAPNPQDDDQVPDDPRAGRAAEDDDHVLGVVRKLVAEGQPAIVRNVRAKSGISNPRTDDAIARLLLDGRIQETAGPKGSRNFTPTKGTDE